jgi:hypothetical protein
MEEPRREPFTVYLSPAQLRAARELAERRETSVGAVLRKYIRDGLEGDGFADVEPDEVEAR